MATTRSSRPSRRSNGSTCRPSAASASRFDTGEAHQPQCALPARDAGRRAAAAGAAAPRGQDRRQGRSRSAWSASTRGLDGVKQRSRTLVELADNLVFYARERRAADRRRQGARASSRPRPRRCSAKLAAALEAETATGARQQIEDAIRRFAEAQGVKLGQVAQPLRVALSGSTVSPGIFEVLAVLGPAETKARLLAASG